MRINTFFFVYKMNIHVCNLFVVVFFFCQCLFRFNKQIKKGEIDEEIISNKIISKMNMLLKHKRVIIIRNNNVCLLIDNNNDLN